MLIRAEEAIQKANRIVRQCGTRNADRIARELGLIVMPRDFSRQKGAYMVIERNRYIFINKHLDPVMHDIVLLHEIGHDCLHRKEAVQVGGLQEFNIFDMRDQRMEYEANMFAAQIALPDDEILEYLRTCAEALGHAPYSYEVEGGRYIAERFVSWSIALTEAKLPLPKGIQKPRREQKLAFLARKNGCQPGNPPETYTG